MYLAIPGKVFSMQGESGTKMTKTSFGVIVRQVCLDLTPEAQMSQYTLVCVCFALEIMDEEEAKQTF